MQKEPVYRCGIRILALLAAVVGLTACGGGGGGGDGGGTPTGAPTFTGINTEAAIDADNAEEIGTTAPVASVYALIVETTGGVLPVGVAVAGGQSMNTAQLVHELSARLIADNPGLSGGNQVIGATTTLTSAQLNQGLQEPLYCGGSVTMTFPDDFDDTGFFDATIVYNNLCMRIDDFVGGGGGIEYTLNGRYDYSNSANGFTATSAMTVSGNDGSETSLFYTMTCAAQFTSCEYASDYVGDDGRTYRVSNVVVSGNEFSGFNVQARFYHPDHGYVEITASNLTFNCAGTPPGWQPGTGQISYTGASGTSGSLTFNNCEEYSWSYNDGAASGNGTWQ